MEFKSSLLKTLIERGLMADCTNVEALDDLAHERAITSYVGFDLTADSLHVGSLVQIMVMRWMHKLGHNPIALMGEATTTIGDPTGKTSSRPMLTRDTIVENRDGIKAVLARVLDDDATFMTNLDWLNRDAGLFSYLQEFGPHFTINRMVALDSVKNRLDNNQPMSFLEFNYMIFQAIDFYHLNSFFSVDLQIGGSDQWGNIIGGIELIRRKNATASTPAKPAFGLTTPLMTNQAGEKMGKTVGGAVWLSPEKTSPFEFWQFWRNVEDESVEKFLKMFTHLPLDKIASVMKDDVNTAKAFLATEVTTLIHGRDAAVAARATARGELDPNSLTVVDLDASLTIAEAFMRAGLVSSKGEADRLAHQGGMKIDSTVVDNARAIIGGRSGDLLRLTVGKKKVAAVRIA